MSNFGMRRAYRRPLNSIRQRTLKLPANLPDIVRESVKAGAQNCIILEMIRSTSGGR